MKTRYTADSKSKLSSQRREAVFVPYNSTISIDRVEINQRFLLAYFGEQGQYLVNQFGWLPPATSIRSALEQQAATVAEIAKGYS